MGKRILSLIVVIGVGCLLCLGYVRYRDRSPDTGDITGNLSRSERSATVATPIPQPGSTVAQPAPAQTNVSAPTSDSIAPNPANGATFAGFGKFQVYRQGNLTWRLDTETGRSCVLFATMEEWKKPIVYTHGCNNR
jgi:hypothetical protein